MRSSSSRLWYLIPGIIFLVVLADLRIWQVVLPSLDTYINEWVSSAHTIVTWPGALSATVTLLGSMEVLTALSLLLIMLCVPRRAWQRVLIVVVAMISTAVGVALLKYIFLRVRPDNGILDVLSDPSFPSAHAAGIAALCVVIGYMYIPRMKSPRGRVVLASILALATLSVGLSRVMLSVHWFSDVIAGWAFGVFVAIMSIYVVRHLMARRA